MISIHQRNIRDPKKDFEVWNKSLQVIQLICKIKVEINLMDLRKQNCFQVLFIKIQKSN